MNFTSPVHPMAYAPRPLHRKLCRSQPRQHGASRDVRARPGFRLPIRLVTGLRSIPASASRRATAHRAKRPEPDELCAAAEMAGAADGRAYPDRRPALIRSRPVTWPASPTARIAADLARLPQPSRPSARAHRTGMIARRSHACWAGHACLRSAARSKISGALGWGWRGCPGLITGGCRRTRSGWG
jgi:hypothetical protein